MVGENFEIYISEMARNALICPPREQILKLCLKWQEIHLICPLWLEKMLKFTSLKWLEMH